MPDQPNGKVLFWLGHYNGVVGSEPLRFVATMSDKCIDVGGFGRKLKQAQKKTAKPAKQNPPTATKRHFHSFGVRSLAADIQVFPLSTPVQIIPLENDCLESRWFELHQLL